MTNVNTFTNNTIYRSCQSTLKKQLKYSALIFFSQKFGLILTDFLGENVNLENHAVKFLG